MIMSCYRLTGTWQLDGRQSGGWHLSELFGTATEDDQNKMKRLDEGALHIGQVAKGSM